MRLRSPSKSPAIYSPIDYSIRYTEGAAQLQPENDSYRGSTTYPKKRVLYPREKHTTKERTTGKCHGSADREEHNYKEGYPFPMGAQHTYR